MSGDKRRADALTASWQDWQRGFADDEKVRLDIVGIDHHTISRQVLSYIDRTHKEFPDETLTIVLPEVAVTHWWEYILRNRTELRLKAALLFRPGIVVTDISSYQEGKTSLPQRTENLSIPPHPKDVKHLFIVPIAGLDRVSKQSLAYARSISNQVVAVHVSIDAHDTEKVRADWDIWKRSFTAEEKTELVVIESPYRSLSRPLLNYIDTVHELYSDYALTVILPEFVVAHWWEYFLHNQTAFQLKTALLFRQGVVVTNVPQHLPSRRGEKREAMEPLLPV